MGLGCLWTTLNRFEDTQAAANSMILWCLIIVLVNDNTVRFVLVTVNGSFLPIECLWTCFPNP